MSLLTPSTMGLMMGTLWLGHDGYLGGDWTVGQVVVAHVALMVGLPAMVGRLAIVGKQVRPSDIWSTDR
jgi:hypothetical protein